MFGRILLGLFIIGIGFLCVWKTDIPLALIGQLRVGRFFFSGSRGVYKVVGVLIIIAGAMIMVGLEDELLGMTIGNLIFTR
jgi:hypothetical protein